MGASLLRGPGGVHGSQAAAWARRHAWEPGCCAGPWQLMTAHDGRHESPWKPLLLDILRP
jgi:hypothetical protein